MPIRPIDLQTLIMQQGQVAREQAAEKEGAALQQAMQGAAAQKRQVEAKEAVSRPEDPKNGAMPVKDRSGGAGARRRGRASEENEGEGSAEGSTEEEVVKDPSLGNRVDFSG
jgi:hypothetical protein